MELTNLERRAWHEAGHATAALFLDQEVGRIVVYDPSERYVGSADPTREEDDGGATKILYNSDEERLRLRHLVICGGYAAETLLIREGMLRLSPVQADHYRRETCSDYLLRYFNMAHVHELPADAWETFCATDEEIADELTEARPRAVLELMARELIRMGDGELRAARMYEVIREHLSSGPDPAAP
jgi:hypothetical protein